LYAPSSLRARVYRLAYPYATSCYPCVSSFAAVSPLLACIHVHVGVPSSLSLSLALYMYVYFLQWFVVGAQYLLYVWKRRSMVTYQKATLALLAVVPALGALRFWAWRFLGAWALYLFGTYRVVAMTKARHEYLCFKKTNAQFLDF